MIQTNPIPTKQSSQILFVSLCWTVALILPLECPAIQQTESNPRPNIILFLVDDLGWQDTSVVFCNSENEKTGFQIHFQTPHVQRLADRGVRFAQAYAHSVCSPTRTSILSGQHPTRHRVTNWTLYPDKDQSGKTERLGPPSVWNVQGQQPNDQLLPQQLKRAGYRTIHCGKAHWGAIGTPGSDPVNLGFDVNIAGHSAGAPGSYAGEQNFGNHEDGTHKLPWGVPGLEKYHGTKTHLTDALATEACLAIDQAVSDQQPFFLYMAPYAVHTPIQAHPRFIDNYLGKNYSGTQIGIPEVEARYASMVEGYDAALGQILNVLTNRNVADKTIILFTSDNGGLSAHTRSTTWQGTGKDTHCWPLKAGKGSAYEGGTRVPMIVSWATTDSGSSLQKTLPFSAGSLSQAKVVCEDIYPTICRWAGIQQNAGSSNELDGIDITKFATDPTATNDRDLLFHYPHVWGPSGEGYQPHSSLRHNDWKIIYFYDSKRWELYNLSTDLSENNDLAVSHPNRLGSMKQLLIQHLTQMQAQYPTDLESGKEEGPN